MTRFLSDRPVAAVALVVLLGLASHFPSLSAGFLWDDNLWLQDSPITVAADGWKTAWSGGIWDWYPLTSTAFWLQWRAFGPEPGGYHAVNLGLHLLGAALLYLVLRRLAVPGSAFLAMLFAVHPVTVGTAAWIAEQKNTLAFVFSAGAALVWVRAVDEEGRGVFLVWLLAAAALLSKATAVALPVLLLLIAVHRRGRWEGRDVRRLGPVFVAAAAVAVVTIWFQMNRTFGTEVAGGLSVAERIGGAGRAIVHYAAQTVAPLFLPIVHPRWDPSSLSPLWWLGLLAPVAFVVVGFRRPGLRGSALAVAAWIVALLPVLGFVDLYYTRYSFVADHWNYLALPLLLIVVVAAAARLPRAVTMPLAIVVLATAVFLSNAQSRRYESARTFWETVQERNPEAWVAWNGLGVWYARQGDPGAAISFFEAAVDAREDYALAWDNLGRALEATGEPAEAVEAYARAVQSNPEFDVARGNYGRALAQVGRRDEGIRELRAVVERRPEAVQPRANLALALAQNYDVHEAIDEYERLLEIDPHFVLGHETVARLYAQRGELDLSLEHMRRVQELQPDHPEAAAVIRALEQAIGLPPSEQEAGAPEASP